MSSDSRTTGALGRGAWIGKYEVLRKLATGGMAEIFLARVAGAGGFEKLVVLKCILPVVAEDDRFVEMFLAEARLAASLHHPNIADVYDVGHEPPTYFYAMEFVHGQDVRTIRQEVKQKQDRVPTMVALSIVQNAAAALDYAHSRTSPDGAPLDLVHRDVSPSNVMVSYEGAVKLLDFGIARARSNSHRTHAGALKGKVPYMSPEQCKGLTLDRRSDLFSLGVVLYELTVGRRPFRGENDFAIMDQIVHSNPPPPTGLVANYPPELEAIVLRLLTAEPASRYPAALDVIHDIDAFVAKHGLWQSPRAIGNYMRTLFAEQIAAWETAEREGVPFAQHLVQSITSASVVTPSAQREIYTGKAPAGPISQPFPVFEPLEGMTEEPGSSASFVGASAMKFDARIPQDVFVPTEPTNISYPPPPTEVPRTTVTPLPELPPRPPTADGIPDLSQRAIMRGDFATEVSPPKFASTVPRRTKDFDPAETARPTTPPDPAFDPEQTARPNKERLPEDVATRVAEPIDPGDPDVPMEFATLSAESDVFRTEVSPPMFAPTVPMRRTEQIGSMSVLAASPSRPAPEKPSLARAPSFLAALASLDDDPSNAGIVPEEAKPRGVSDALDSLEDDAKPSARRPVSVALASLEGDSQPAATPLVTKPVDDAAEGRARREAQERAKQAARDQDEARREALRQADALREASTLKPSRTSSDEFSELLDTAKTDKPEQSRLEASMKAKALGLLDTQKSTKAGDTPPLVKPPLARSPLDRLPDPMSVSRPSITRPPPLTMPESSADTMPSMRRPSTPAIAKADTAPMRAEARPDGKADTAPMKAESRPSTPVLSSADTVPSMQRSSAPQIPIVETTLRGTLPPKDKTPPPTRDATPAPTSKPPPPPPPQHKTPKPTLAGIQTPTPIPDLSSARGDDDEEDAKTRLRPHASRHTPKPLEIRAAVDRLDQSGAKALEALDTLDEESKIQTRRRDSRPRIDPAPLASRDPEEQRPSAAMLDGKAVYPQLPAGPVTKVLRIVLLVVLLAGLGVLGYLVLQKYRSTSANSTGSGSSQPR